MMPGTTTSGEPIRSSVRAELLTDRVIGSEGVEIEADCPNCGASVKVTCNLPIVALTFDGPVEPLKWWGTVFIDNPDGQIINEMTVSPAGYGTVDFIAAREGVPLRGPSYRVHECDHRPEGESGDRAGLVPDPPARSDGEEVNVSRRTSN
jgi:hypothetical protein